MTFCFNADEVLKMAEEIERKGARFYREAAEVEQDESTRRKLLELAEMEDQHERTFAGMRKELTATEVRPVTFDPEGQTEQYLMAMADSSVFTQAADPAALVAGKSTADVLMMALNFEKDSILFYLGLQDIACHASSKERVGRVLKEEMAHVTLLRAQLETLH